MPDLLDGEEIKVQGSAKQPYQIKNLAGLYSCSCPAWRNQSLPIDRRSCKHIRKLRVIKRKRFAQAVRWWAWGNLKCRSLFRQCSWPAPGMRASIRQIIGLVRSLMEREP